MKPKRKYTKHIQTLKKIPMEVVMILADPQKDSKGRTKRDKIKLLIDFLQARGAEKHIKIVDHLFLGLRYYVPLVKGIEGGYPDLNLEELVEG